MITHVDRIFKILDCFKHRCVPCLRIFLSFSLCDDTGSNAALKDKVWVEAQTAVYHVWYSVEMGILIDVAV